MNELDFLRGKYNSIVFHDLEVFETGDVFKVGKNKSMVKTDKAGYQRVGVKINGALTSRSVSRLVYKLFIEPEFDNNDNRYYIDTNGKRAGEYVLSDIKKVRSLGTHKRVFAKNEKWGN